jgi:hypothetical protein
MKLFNLSSVVAAVAMSLLAGPASALVVNASNNATSLATLLAGPGITISNAVLFSASTTGSGTFTGGANAIGFEQGVLLTTGTVNCAPGPNNNTGCSGTGGGSSLKFDFTSSTGNIFFNYVFASEEYNEFVGSSFNDQFQLLLNGVNIATLPGNAGAVTINNVNLNTNSNFYRNNTGTGSLNLDTQYDGLTTVLTASAAVLSGKNTFEFKITDIGDSSLDSGVFIQAGTFSATVPPGSNVPEPSTIAMLGLGLLGLATMHKKKRY